MKNILITGISGFLGQYLYKYKPQDVNITGTYFLNYPKFSDVELIQLDLTKPDEFINRAKNFDVVIHCAANANLGECEKNPESAFKINSLATEKLAQWSFEQNSKFIFLSTDIVFDGLRGNYSENDLPNPINVYGKTKFEAEKKLLNIHGNLIILRLALCLGKGLATTTSFIDWFHNKLEKREDIPLYYDEIRTPVSSNYAAMSIWNMINSNYQGILHLTGKEKLSRYQLGAKLLDYLKSDQHYLLKKISSKNSTYPRPMDVSMQSDYLNKILELPHEDISTLIENIL